MEKKHHPQKPPQANKSHEHVLLTFLALLDLGVWAHHDGMTWYAIQDNTPMLMLIAAAKSVPSYW